MPKSSKEESTQIWTQIAAQKSCDIFCKWGFIYITWNNAGNSSDRGILQSMFFQNWAHCGMVKSKLKIIFN